MKTRDLLAITVFLLALQFGQGLLAAEERGLLQALIARSNELLEAYSSYQLELEALESQFGAYDQSLLEPLDSLIALKMETGDYQQVAVLQERQLQLIRTTMGLEHPEVIPVLQDIIANQIRLQAWQAVSDRLEHIRDVVGANSSFSTEDLLSAIDDQAYWHLSQVYLEDRRSRSRNFMLARSLYRQAASLAEDNYGSESPELIPWLYQRAVGEYHLVKFLNASDGLGFDTRDALMAEDGRARLQSSNRVFIDVDALFGPFSNIAVVVEGHELGYSYLRQGLGFINQIEEIAAAEGDAEALAMAGIYRGDFQLLRDNGTAFREYREARELLREAGIADSKIEALFSQPSVIPVARYFTRFEELLSHQAETTQQATAVPKETIHVGELIAWDESLPAIRKPHRGNSILNVDLAYNRLDLSFTINSRGKVSAVKVLGAEPDERSVRRKALRALRDVQFRPAIVGGKATRLRDVQIRYLFLQE